MTGEQLKKLDALFAEKAPGWRVARGGIITTKPTTGIDTVACNNNGKLPNKVFLVNFDTMTLVAAQG